MNDNENGAVQMRLITRSAQRAIAGLSPESRRRVCQALVKPVPRQNCTRLHGTVLPNVWHFRVSDSLRITFVYGKNQKSMPCVVHAGRHKAMERFLTVWDGGVTHVSEIEEFAMKEKHVNGKQSNKSLLVPTQGEALASNEDELLVQALRAIRRGNSENLETLLELHFEPITRAVTKQLGEIECSSGRLDKLQKSVAAAINTNKAITLDIGLPQRYPIEYLGTARAYRKSHCRRQPHTQPCRWTVHIGHEGAAESVGSQFVSSAWRIIGCDQRSSISNRAASKRAE